MKIKFVKVHQFIKRFFRAQQEPSSHTSSEPEPLTGQSEQVQLTDPRDIALQEAFRFTMPHIRCLTDWYIIEQLCIDEGYLHTTIGDCHNDFMALTARLGITIRKESKRTLPVASASSGSRRSSKKVESNSSDEPHFSYLNTNLLSKGKQAYRIMGKYPAWISEVTHKPVRDKARSIAGHFNSCYLHKYTSLIEKKQKAQTQSA